MTTMCQDASLHNMMCCHTTDAERTGCLEGMLYRLKIQGMTCLSRLFKLQ